MNPSSPPPPLGERAVVLGASLAGLLAARVLSERFAEVLLLERDALPDGPALRKGTPQALQPHGLLARGREVLEELFPGITATWMAQGASAGDLGEQVAFVADGARFAQATVGRIGIGVSRLAIEAELRRRVLARPGVRVLTGVDVVAPVYDAATDAVTGVRIERQRRDAAGHDARDPDTVQADLVVDCTGRGSRLPGWLLRWGYAAPAETRVPVGLCYASVYLERDADAPVEQAAVIVAATPARPWPGVLIAQEPQGDGPPRWVVGVGGYAGDHPQATLESMRARAAQTGSAELSALLADGRPLGPVQRYLFAHSQRRHYERLRQFPARLLALGDSIASFNPVYGQGMTVAACEALALRDALAQGLSGLHRRYFRAAARVVDVPWQLAVGADLALPNTPGARPLAVRLVNAYIARLQRVAPHDAVVAAAFLRVVHLTAPPTSLFSPRLLWRVARGPRREAATALPGPARALAPQRAPTP